MKKNTKKQLLNIFFVVALAVVTIVILIKSNEELNFQTLKEFFAACNAWYLVGAVVCMLLFIFFEALSVHIILRKFGYKPKWRSSLAYSTSDVYYSAITPSATGGQPASAYYMVKDGVSGGASCFALIFNLVGYTAAIILLGGGALVCRFDLFLGFDTFVKVLIVIGIVSQVFLLAFFIACMCWHSGVLKVGNFGISLLLKIRLMKNGDKWRGKLEGVVEKYRSCYACFREHKTLTLWVLLCNVAQRAALIMVSAFVCAAASDCNMAEVFALQAFVVLGYNSIPLPGGAVAFEYLYLNVYEGIFAPAFILVAMMVTRVISYYCSMLLSGVYTIGYHIGLMKRAPKDEDKENENENEREGEVCEDEGTKET